MEAGRELDALVAEKVMGIEVDLVVAPFIYYSPYRDRYDEWAAGNEPYIDKDGDIHLIPRYSTDIAAAWLVVEKMRETRWIEVHSTIDGEWAAFYTPIGTTDMNQAIHEYAKASTAPLAICLAALKAVGI